MTTRFNMEVPTVNYAGAVGQAATSANDAALAATQTADAKTLTAIINNAVALRNGVYNPEATAQLQSTLLSLSTQSLFTAADITTANVNSLFWDGYINMTTWLSKIQTFLATQ